MYHCHIRWVRRSHPDSAIRRLEYISRTGRYALRPDKVRVIASGNMPPWVTTHDAAGYWRAADGTANRVNARLMYMVECALPRELSVAAQNELAFAFIDRVAASTCGRELAHGLPFTLAVHEGHGTNPHLHAMLSTSINDHVRRSEAQWFRRAHPDDPAAGGARRSRYIGRRHWLLNVRKEWADMANAALAAAGIDTRISELSNAARRLTEKPGIHLGPHRTVHASTGAQSWAGFRTKMLGEVENMYRLLRLRISAKKREVAMAVAELNSIRRARKAAAHALIEALAKPDWTCSRGTLQLRRETWILETGLKAGVLPAVTPTRRPKRRVG